MNEQVFYEAPGVQITNARVHIAGVNFSPASIAAVRAHPVPGGGWFRVVMLVVMLVGMASGCTAKLGEDVQRAASWLLALVALLLAALSSRFFEPTFDVYINVNGAEVQALKRLPRATSDEITSAIVELMATHRR